MTEQTMIERVAMAIKRARYYTPGLWSPKEVEEEISRPLSSIEIGFARAAIEAMREPTEMMIDRFVSRALCVSVHGDGGWSDYGHEQWKAMIDEALKEEEPS